MNRITERLYNGIVKENPTFVQMLGMCPTLAVTSTAINGLGMGLATTVVLTMSNLLISALRKVIPDKVRIPAFITIIASFVTIVSFIMQAYTPELYDSLGVFISLIVVNCIILGRAEAYASSHPVIPSIFDGLGMGLGFTLGLTLIGILRELLGAGTVFGVTVTKELWNPIAIFTSNPGAFFVLAFIVAGINAFAIRKAKKKGEKPKLRRIDTCAGCTNMACQGRKFCGEEESSGNAAASGKTAVKVNADEKRSDEKRSDEKRSDEKKLSESKAGSEKPSGELDATDKGNKKTEVRKSANAAKTVTGSGKNGGKKELEKNADGTKKPSQKNGKDGE